MSRLLTRKTLLNFYEIILIVNCWMTPILKRVCGDNKFLERLLVVLFDLLLDFVSSIGVPVVIAAGYLAIYDPLTKDFSPPSISYDDVWLLNFLNEAPIVFFGSWLDAISRLVFSIGLLWAIDDVKELLTKPLKTGITADVPPKDKSIQRQLPEAIGPSFASTSDSPKSTRIASIVSKWVHRLLVVWGVVIFVLYLDSLFRASASFCALELRPWLVRFPACAVVKIDCREHQSITGEAGDFARVFQNLDIGSVEYIVYRHCPQVEIPSQFVRFRSIYGLKAYNSTIYRWDANAAFTFGDHPRARFVYFARAEFVDAILPAGLLHQEFPSTLTDIEISISNLRRLPSTLPWPPTTAVFVELSELTEFPMALISIHPSVISIVYNHITSFPAELIMTPDIGILFLSGNPIQELPPAGVDITKLHDTGSGLNLFLLAIDHTNVHSFPDWMTEEFAARVQLSAAGSPICTKILRNTSSPERAELLRDRPWLAKASCEPDRGVVGVYPLFMDDAEG